MKKYLAILMVALMLVGISASAAVARSTLIMPTLDFDDGQVLCGLVVSAQDYSDEITAEIRLYRGIFRIKKWNVEAIGELDFGETRSAAAGATYRLEVDVTVGGTEYPTRTLERTND